MSTVNPFLPLVDVPMEQEKDCTTFGNMQESPHVKPNGASLVSSMFFLNAEGDLETHFRMLSIIALHKVRSFNGIDDTFQDACAEGWHICSSVSEVKNRLGNGTCSDVGRGFYVSAQSGGGCAVCAVGTQTCSSGDCRSTCKHFNLKIHMEISVQKISLIST